MSVCTETVGTPYWVSSVTQWPATAGAHVLQCPTPMIAASPFCLDLSKESGIVLGVNASLPYENGLDRRHVPREPCLHLQKEAVAVIEARIDEVNRLAIESV